MTIYTKHVKEKFKILKTKDFLLKEN